MECWLVFIASQVLDKCDPSSQPRLSTENTNNQQSGPGDICQANFKTHFHSFRVSLEFYFMNIAKTAFETFEYILVIQKVARASLHLKMATSLVFIERKRPCPSIGNFNDLPNVTLLIQCPLFGSDQWPAAYLCLPANVALASSFPFFLPLADGFK